MIVSTGATDAASLVVSSFPGVTIQLNKLDGYINGVAATQYFLMIFALDAVPANGTVPLKTLMVLGANGFTFAQELAGLEIGEYCTVALSSTHDVFTASAVTMNLSADINAQGYSSFPTKTTVGDKTTDVQTRQLWANASGPKKLLSVDVTETAGVDSYVQIICADNLDPTTIILQLRLLANATVNLRFGPFGTTPFMQKLSHTLHQGCNVSISTTSGSDDGQGQGTIYAKYMD